MVNTLILMRHGKAQQPEFGIEDFDRHLTAAGKRSLVATLPESLGRYSNDAVLHIWSSPAKRALQTARLAQKACEKLGIVTAPEIEIVDELWEQDYHGFMARIESSEDEAVLAVGHNPFIEETLENLTGSRIVFATGGLAAVGLGSGYGCFSYVRPGRLLWFSQGPISQRWKTLVKLERVLEEATDTVQTRMDAFAADPEDPETLHKVRTSIRTLRSLVKFVAPWQNRAQNKAVQADLKTVVASTSRLRELDVFSAQAQAAPDASPEFVEFCAEKAAAEREHVHEVLLSKQTTRRLKRVADQLKNVQWKARLNKEGLDASEVRTRFDALAESLEAELTALDLADAEATHDVRKNAKQVRYSAERYGELIGEDAVQVAQEMKGRQDDLGAICDARVNIGIIDSLVTEDLPEPVAWDLALLRAKNETFLYTALRNSRQ